MSFLTSARPALRATTSISSTLLTSTATSSLSRSGALPSLAAHARALSKFTIVGRLAANPELITTSSGRELVRYAVGTNHGSGENKSVSWWKVAAFLPEGGMRDNLLGLGKGSLVYVEGDVSMKKFEREGRTETGISMVQTKYDVLDRRESVAQADIIEEE